MEPLTRRELTFRVRSVLGEKLELLGFVRLKSTLPGWCWKAANGADIIGVWYQIETFARAYYFPKLAGLATQPLAIRIDMAPSRVGTEAYELALAGGNLSIGPRLRPDRREVWRAAMESALMRSWRDIGGTIAEEELEGIELNGVRDAPFFPAATSDAVDMWAAVAVPDIIDLAARGSAELGRKLGSS